MPATAGAKLRRADKIRVWMRKMVEKTSKFFFCLFTTGAVLIVALALVLSFGQSFYTWYFWVLFALSGVFAFLSRWPLATGIFGCGAALVIWDAFTPPFDVVLSRGGMYFALVIVVGVASAIVGYTVGHVIGTSRKNKYSPTF